MIRGIYTAAAGLATATLRLGVVSNNVANSQTPGYKTDQLPAEIGKSLDLLKLATDPNGNPVGAVTLGPRSGLSRLDLSQGSLQETGNQFDLALGGPGFFAVQANGGPVRYTRDGGFRVDSQGMLLARDGSGVLNTAGQPIQVPSGRVDVGADGALLVNGVQIDQLQIVDFPAGQLVDKTGNGQLAPQNGATPQPANPNTQVYQGYLETSNVDVTDQTVASMQLVRAYQANQRVLTIQDETLQKTVNEVGKV